MLRTEIHWLDSGTAHSDGWQKGEDIMARTKIGKVITVGWLMGETDDAVYVGLSYDPDHDMWYNAQAIAKQSIISRETLRVR